MTAGIEAKRLAAVRKKQDMLAADRRGTSTGTSNSASQRHRSDSSSSSSSTTATTTAASCDNVNIGVVLDLITDGAGVWTVGPLVRFRD
jgi:hypothetical protein